MFRIVKCTKDTYITDRLLNNRRMFDANVGQAGTLDLFKLYGESNVSGSTIDPTELSRVLLKFNFDTLRALTASTLNFAHPSFKARLKLYDVIGGQTIPSNFKLSLFPLSRSFDEGVGRDIYKFQDIDTANFYTSSYVSGQNVLWTLSGANSYGDLGSSTADVLVNGDLNDGNGLQRLYIDQEFVTGEEDLDLDITTIVSATLANVIPDHGFRLSYSSSYENDDKTYFVKRFASRHSSNVRMKPRIEIFYDDSIIDNHANFYFDLSGTLYLRSFARRQLANIVSGSSLTPITGQNCMHLKIQSGSFSMIVSASQHAYGVNQVTGLYSASFAIPSNEQLLLNEIRNAKSASFNLVWQSVDNTVPYLSSTLVIKAPDYTSYSDSSLSTFVTFVNLKESYNSNEVVRIRLFAFDNKQNYTPKRLPIYNPGIVFEKIYYGIVDANSNETLINVDTTYNSTRVSTDSDGMYFDLYTQDLDVGRSYKIIISVLDGGRLETLNTQGTTFRIE